jgi:hypothetical protein
VAAGAAEDATAATASVNASDTAMNSFRMGQLLSSRIARVDGGFTALDRRDTRCIAQKRRDEAPPFLLGCEDSDDPRRVDPGCATLIHETWKLLVAEALQGNGRSALRRRVR